MEEARCYRDGEEIKKAERAFYEIKGKGEIVVYGDKEFEIKKEYKRIKAMYDIIRVIMRDMNDYLASSLAYEYLMPRVNAFLRYVIYSDMIYIESDESGREEYRYIKGVKPPVKQRGEIEEWGEEVSTSNEIIRRDGSRGFVNNLEYLYKEIRQKGMAMAGKYYVHYNIQYLELEKPRKSYPSRMRVLRSAVWWSNQMLLNIYGLRMIDGVEYSEIEPEEIIFSTMPSSGKSYVCNTINEMFSILSRNIQKKGGCLRVGNQENNILGQSRQTMGLILNRLILDIYPEMREYLSTSGKFQPFEKGSEEEWGLKGCEYTPEGSIFKTRDSAINSVRCQLGMFDDPSRGLQESNNISIHKKICDIFNGDFQDRFENQSEKRILLTGTMFNPEDVFSKEIQSALGHGYTKDTRFRNTYISKDKKKIVILNDCEDEYGESAFPEFITSNALAEKREKLSEYDYRCIWRQKPIPAEGLIFSKEYLSFYDEIPPVDEFSDYAMAAIDPTRRKASDFFSMPIFRYHIKSRKWYLVDIIFRQVSILQLYDKIVDKIFSHKIVKIAYEENTDTSLGVALQAKLKERNHNEPVKWCTLQQIYSTQNKLARITDLKDVIIQNMVFPSEKCKSTKSEIGLAVHKLTEFNGDKQEHDDFPDSLAMFADKCIVNANKVNYLKVGNKLPF